MIRLSPQRTSAEFGTLFFLDSGAYSAFTLGTEIPLDEYIAYLQEHQHELGPYAVLDAIGDPRRTWEHQLEMERQGLHPLPCFHYGEDESWLKRYLDRYDYLALGGMVPYTTVQQQRWLDRLFDQYLTDVRGHPRLDVHGFGMTTLELMLRYPWCSVDSTSWLMTSRFGGVLLWLNERSVSIAVSQHSPTQQRAGQHYRTLSSAEQRAVAAAVETQGFSIQDVETNYRARDAVCARFFVDLEDRWQARPFSRKQLQRGFDLT